MLRGAPFISLKPTEAERIIKKWKARPPDLQEIFFVGEWQSRRFVIEDLKQSAEYIETDFVSIPKTTADDMVRRLMSFGAAIVRRVQSENIGYEKPSQRNLVNCILRKNIAMCFLVAKNFPA